MEAELFQSLAKILQEQGRSDDEQQQVLRSFHYALGKHEGQFRKNQDKYIIHPVHVAIILAKVPVDTPTVCAALLHDVLEDTDASSPKKFGLNLARMCFALSKALRSWASFNLNRWKNGMPRIFGRCFWQWQTMYGSFY